jgi:hypothetical protein
MGEADDMVFVCRDCAKKCSRFAIAGPPRDEPCGLCGNVIPRGEGAGATILARAEPVLCHCGGKPWKVEYNGTHDTSPRIECWDCGVATKGDAARTMQSAIKRWNWLQERLCAYP